MERKSRDKKLSLNKNPTTIKKVLKHVSLWTAQRSWLINIHEKVRLKFKNESASRRFGSSFNFHLRIAWRFHLVKALYRQSVSRRSLSQISSSTFTEAPAFRHIRHAVSKKKYHVSQAHFSLETSGFSNCAVNLQSLTRSMAFRGFCGSGERSSRVFWAEARICINDCLRVGTIKCDSIDKEFPQHYNSRVHPGVCRTILRQTIIVKLHSGLNPNSKSLDEWGRAFCSWTESHPFQWQRADESEESGHTELSWTAENEKFLN